MTRFRHTDILVELIELCQERMLEIRQQLTYYRASVYKAETANLINGKVEQMRLIGDLFGDLLLQETFDDYESMAKAGAMSVVPGECSFSKRVTLLLGALDGHMTRLSSQIQTRALTTNEADFAETVRKHRNQLLALCRHGSRQWTFFESL